MSKKSPWLDKHTPSKAQAQVISDESAAEGREQERLTEAAQAARVLRQGLDKAAREAEALAATQADAEAAKHTFVGRIKEFWQTFNL
jgi:hypothetical protein